MTVNSLIVHVFNSFVNILNRNDGQHRAKDFPITQNGVVRGHKTPNESNNPSLAQQRITRLDVLNHSQSKELLFHVYLPTENNFTLSRFEEALNSPSMLR